MTMHSYAAAATFALVLGAGPVAASTPAFAEDPALLTQVTHDARVVVWDGETANVGSGWVNPTRSTFAAQTSQAHSGASALELKFSGNSEWIGAGWNWFNFKTGDDIGTDVTGLSTFSFWIKVQGKPVQFRINLQCNGTVLDTPEQHSARVDVLSYAPNIFDGHWHEVRIPLRDLIESEGFNPRVVSQLQLDLTVGPDTHNSFFIDDISFDNRPAK
ncbi:hypothetical protein ABAC402_02860 [Asticcacaulis sp. AC402]|nr:hypothetical protein ABAC402_02860 [Asticcacaulis sp. AC402]